MVVCCSGRPQVVPLCLTLLLSALVQLSHASTCFAPHQHSSVQQPSTAQHRSKFSKSAQLSTAQHGVKQIAFELVLVKYYRTVVCCSCRRVGWDKDDVWFAHCCMLDDAETKQWADDGVGIAHCPSSNMRLASGIAPVSPADPSPAPA